MCVKIGAGLHLNLTAAGGPALEAVAVAPVLPRMVAETIPLVTIPVSQATLDYTLAKTPAANTLVLAFVRGGLWSNGVGAGTSLGKALQFVLPDHRGDGDEILVVYWTLEP